MSVPSNFEARSGADPAPLDTEVQSDTLTLASRLQSAPAHEFAMRRPDRSEYDEYYDRYVSLVPDGDIAAMLASHFPVTRRLLETVPADRESWAYAPGKWSFREVIGHLADAERVLAGRALWIARDPDTPLPSMEQDAWVANSGARERPLAELLDEWAAVRTATVALVRSFDAVAVARTGTASGVRFTVQSLPWIIAGHELHHRQVLREHYGLAGDVGS